MVNYKCSECNVEVDSFEFEEHVVYLHPEQVLQFLNDEGSTILFNMGKEI